VYSAAHFARSGILQPLDHPNLGKFNEQVWPLRPNLETGAPVHTTNPAQYGPVFFFVMHPLLRAHPDDETLARWLYAIQLVLIAASFVLTCATLKLASPVSRADSWPLLVAWLAVIWLNFSPLYTILALKSVETWELLLISLGLYAHLREWRWTAALAIACAALIKVLPAVFIYYWLIADRRTFGYACVMLAGLLLASHLLYGAEMGLWYLPRVLAGAAGDSYGLNWHENISLKAAFAKLFGHLPAPTRDGALTSGYFLVLTGWRKTAATVLGDAAVIAAVAGVTWTGLRRTGPRTREIRLWEWSVLAVVVLIVSPNTIFEYVTIALGAVSYAFARIALSDRRVTPSWVAFVVSLLLIGGLVPRQVLNRLTMIAVLNRWTGHTHLTASEAYQYYGFPLAGLLLFLCTMWRLEPATRVPSQPT
jgi:hypothetical protein